MKDDEAFTVGFLDVWKDDFVNTKGRFVKDDLGLALFVEESCFRNEKIHGGEDTRVEKTTDSKCEFEAQVLNNETSNELAILYQY